MGQIVSDVTDLLDYKDAKKAAKTQRKEILSQMASDEKEKINLVKKALATQRAKFGASGMSTSGISEGAVLKRLESETSAPSKKIRWPSSLYAILSFVFESMSLTDSASAISNPPSMALYAKARYSAPVST